jgi:hypothetical protein
MNKIHPRNLFPNEVVLLQCSALAYQHSRIKGEVVSGSGGTTAIPHRMKTKDIS